MIEEYLKIHTAIKSAEAAGIVVQMEVMTSKYDTSTQTGACAFFNGYPVHNEREMNVYIAGFLAGKGAP